MLSAVVPLVSGMAVTLHGSPQSRSPLVNWYAIEAGIPFSMAPPRPSNHPFGQIPFLTDDDCVEVFESGACLLYLADKYKSSSAVERASWTKWVVWANSELDGLCFGAVPGDHRVRGESMSRPDVRSVGRLDEILGEREWLVGDEFSVADAAVASYLNCALAALQTRDRRPGLQMELNDYALALRPTRRTDLPPRRRPERHAQHVRLHAALRPAAGLR